MQLQPAGTCCCRCHVPTCVTLLPATIVSVPGATGGAAVKSIGGAGGGGCQDGERRGADPHCSGPEVGRRAGGLGWVGEGAGVRLLPAVLSGRENGEGAGSGSGHRGSAISTRSS